MQLRQLETARAARRRQQLARAKPQVSAPAPPKACASKDVTKEGPGKPQTRTKSPGAGAETCADGEHAGTRAAAAAAAAAAREAGQAGAKVASSRPGRKQERRKKRRGASKSPPPPWGGAGVEGGLDRGREEGHFDRDVPPTGAVTRGGRTTRMKRGGAGGGGATGRKAISSSIGAQRKERMTSAIS